MDKVSLIDLKKKTYIRSALIALPSLDDLLGMNDNFSADEIFLEIVKRALREFELYHPLVLDMRLTKNQLCYNGGIPGYAEIISNFDLYLDCKIAEGDIILVPNSTPKWSTFYAGWGWPSAYGGFDYVTDYKRPHIFIQNLPFSFEYLLLRGICSRPIVPDFRSDRSFNPDSTKSAVYWMNAEEGPLATYFIDLCLCHLLDYIRQLKSSIMLPSAGIDVMANVDNAYMELRSRCDQTLIQSGWDGQTLI